MAPPLHGSIAEGRATSAAFCVFGLAARHGILPGHCQGSAADMHRIVEGFFKARARPPH